MLFISYNVSGLRYFLSLSIPVAVFLSYYIYCNKKYKRDTPRPNSYYLTSQILLVYIVVFFLYIFFGLKIALKIP